MKFLFIIAVTIFFLDVAKISSLYKKHWISSLLAFIILFVVSGFVTYTPDMEGYITLFEEDLGRDFMFNAFTVYFKSFGWDDFQYIHITYIALSASFLVLFIHKFKTDTLFVVLLYISIIFLHFTTQISFFLGYFSMCLALYYFYKKNNKYTIVFFIIGVASHISLFIFLPFFFLIRLNVKHIYRVIIYSNLAIILLGSFIFSVVFLFFPKERFLEYVETENITSILGAILVFTPSLISFFVVVFIREKYNNLISTFEDNEDLDFLFKASIIFYALFGLAFIIQIIGYRFIIPAMIFQILFMLILANKMNSFNMKVVLYSILFVHLFSTYFLLDYVLGTHSSQLDGIKTILESNIILNKLLL